MVEPQMDYSDDIVILFWALTVVITWQSMEQSQASCFFYPKYLKICSKDDQIFFGFGTIWDKVINEKIFILGWSKPLIPVLA